MSHEEMQKFIVETVTQLNSKQDKSELSLTELKTAIEDSTTTSREALNIDRQLSHENKTLRIEVDQVKFRNSQLSSENDKLTERIIKLESHSRRDDLIFEGVAESTPDDVHVKLLAIFKDKLKLENPENIKIVRAHRLGKRNPGTYSEPRSIIVKFHWYGDRTEVWQAKKNLKGSNIFVNKDFPREMQDRCRILRPIMVKAKIAKKAFLNVDSLIIDGRAYSIHNLNTLPIDLHPGEVATPTVGENIRAFFGTQSPLSNFHPSKFQVDGIAYDWNEQFY